MTYKEVNEIIASIGLPYAYNEFPEGTEQTPPFICFLFDDSNDFTADNVNYQKIRGLEIELYTDNKDFALENTIETVLTQNGFVYIKNETYIDGEKMFQITFSTQVIITEE